MTGNSPPDVLHYSEAIPTRLVEGPSRLLAGQAHRLHKSPARQSPGSSGDLAVRRGPLFRGLRRPTPDKFGGEFPKTYREVLAASQEETAAKAC
jgi:hypothetical protein